MRTSIVKKIVDYYKRGGVSLIMGKILRCALLSFRNKLGEVLFAKLETFFMLGYWPNLKRPKSFNEKICFRKLYVPHPLSNLVCDKWAVRDYVLEKTDRPDILTTVYYIGNDPEDIDFKKLPPKFVIKATHGSGWNVFVTDIAKINKNEIIKKCYVWLQSKYSLASGNVSEKHYDKIVPKILIEEFIEDPIFKVPLDYKFFCFHGKAKYIQVDIDRYNNHQRIFYDINWHEIDLRLCYLKGKGINKPSNLSEMVYLAEKIAQEFDFCRVDFYCIKNKRVLFGEITLAPESGLGRFYPREWDYRLGQLW